jgi:histidinol phosphatase-like enzyme
MIGDKESDIQLAQNAKIGNSIFIGDKAHTTTTLSFQNVAQCYQYFQENKDKIYH